MRKASWMQYVFLAHFSRPTQDRVVYRLVRERKVSRIFEIGIGDLRRTLNVLHLAERYASEASVKYAAIDWFDARGSARPRLTLIESHRVLKTTSATVRLIPGAPVETVASVANAHPGTDLILVAPEFSMDSMRMAWPWIPRMLHSDSRVLCADTSRAGDGFAYHQLTLSAVTELAAASRANLAA